jgi:hypothetical protein
MVQSGFGVKNGPPSEAVAGPSGAAASQSSSAFGVNQRTQIVKTIGRNHASGYKLPQSSFDFSFELSRCADDISEE